MKNKKVKDVCVADGVDQNVIQMHQSDFLALRPMSMGFTNDTCADPGIIVRGGGSRSELQKKL